MRARHCSRAKARRRLRGLSAWVLLQALCSATGARAKTGGNSSGPVSPWLSARVLVAPEDDRATEAERRLLGVVHAALWWCYVQALGTQRSLRGDAQGELVVGPNGRVTHATLSPVASTDVLGVCFSGAPQLSFAGRRASATLRFWARFEPEP